LAWDVLKETHVMKATQTEGGKTMEIVCYNQVNRGDWCQEIYDTQSRNAGRRARLLRRAGYDVRVQALGPQITRVGRVKMTILHITPGTHQDTYDLPPVKIERL